MTRNNADKLRTVALAAVAAGALLVAGPVVAESFASDRIAVTTVGDDRAPDMVLIPGLGAGPAVWTEAAADLEGYRIHLVQVRGFAGLPAQANATGALLEPIAAEIGRYLAVEAGEDAVLVGHSMGGTLALLVAAEAEVRGVVVVDTPPAMGAIFAGASASDDEVRDLADALRDGMEASNAQAWAVQAEAFVAGMVTAPAAREALRDAYLASDRDVVTRAFHELLVTDLGPLLPGVDEPVALIHVAPKAAGGDPEQVDAFYRGAYAALGDATFERVDDAGHYVMLDNPDGFAAALDRAIASF